MRVMPYYATVNPKTLIFSLETIAFASISGKLFWFLTWEAEVFALCWGPPDADLEDPRADIVDGGGGGGTDPGLFLNRALFIKLSIPEPAVYEEAEADAVDVDEPDPGGVNDAPPLPLNDAIAPAPDAVSYTHLTLPTKA